MSHINVNGREVTVSRHALERFVARWGQYSPQQPKLNKPLQTIRKLLTKATPEELTKEVKLKRLLSNGCAEAEYWLNSGWRFVIVSEDREVPTLVTVERNLFG